VDAVVLRKPLSCPLQRQNWNTMTAFSTFLLTEDADAHQGRDS